MLFRYLKKSKKKIVWTFHDCWNFTGGCPHFDSLNCEKWKMGCYACQYKGYPETFFDCSKTQFKRKKRLFCGIESLYIVTPSQWLKSKVEESFLNKYPVSVINNGIDLSVFNPKNNTEEIRRKYGIKSKYMVLGVSYAWDKRKGLDTFIKLSSELGDDYTMVLVGTDKSVRALLPENIISVDRTSSAEELAELYSAADVFANPTLEENFPTVNIESLACGTPIVSFDTGGSPEIFCEKSGISVRKGDVESLKNSIIDVCEKSLFSSENCVSRSKQFDESLFAKRYMELYQKIL
jgi:glycosyltransferase involved in cell wall biosynthesis